LGKLPNNHNKQDKLLKAALKNYNFFKKSPRAQTPDPTHKIGKWYKINKNEYE
jgi:hypothetical protein